MGSLVQEILGISGEQTEIRLGHPGGVFPVNTKIEKRGDSYEYLEAEIGRTARRLMEGYVFVPPF